MSRKRKLNIIRLRISLIGILILSLLSSLSNFAPLTFKVPAARAVDPDMLIFWDSNSSFSASGWTCISDDTTDTFYNRYVYGASSYGTQSGSASHSHTVSYVSETAEFPTLNADNKGSGTSTPGNSTHTHGGPVTATVTTASNLPLYNMLRAYRYTAGGVPTTIPSGAILLFKTTSMSANWEVYTTQNSQFLRAGATTATGGDSTPTHTVAAGLPATNASTTVSASASTFASPTHSHSIGSGVATDGPSIEPPYREVVFGRATANITTFPDGMIAGFTSTSVGSAWSVVSDTGGTYNNRFLKGDNGTLSSGGSSTHSHANVAPTTGNPVGTVTDVDNFPPFASVSSSTHTHDVTVQLESNVDHTPQYATLVLAQYTTPIYTPQMNNWRWYADEGDETPGTAYANETTGATPNEPPQVEMGKNIPLKLRINITETGGAGENNSRKKLQWSTDQSTWTNVSEVDVLGTFVYTTDISGGDDNVAITTQLLTGTTQSGIHNESNSAGPSNSDHTASATLELEYAFEISILAAVSTAYYFQLYDEVLAAAIPLGSGKCRPKFTTAAAFSLTVGAPSAVFLGTWEYGDGEYHSYTFAGGEEITNRDNRGFTGGKSSGWTCSADITTQLTSGSKTILKSNMYWITNTITGLYDAPTTGISGNSGEYMGSAVTAITAASGGYQGLGGFTILPTIRIYGAPAQGDYTGGVLTLTTI